MRRVGVVALVGAVACAVRPAAGTGSHASACGRTAVTRCEGVAPDYRTEVRPVVERRCWRCHTGDGVAAEEHDFSRFETLHAQSAMLAQDVVACAMPPSTEPPLDELEAGTLARWVACGAMNH